MAALMPAPPLRTRAGAAPLRASLVLTGADAPLLPFGVPSTLKQTPGRDSIGVTPDTAVRRRTRLSTSRRQESVQCSRPVGRPAPVFQLSASQQRQCQRVFHSAGGVTSDNIAAVLSQLHMEPAQSAVLDFCKERKLDSGGGYFSFQDFCDFVARQLEAGVRDRAQRDADALEAFSALGGGRNGEGTLDAGVLRDACELFTLGVDLTRLPPAVGGGQRLSFGRFKSLLEDGEIDIAPRWAVTDGSPSSVELDVDEEVSDVMKTTPDVDIRLVRQGVHDTLRADVLVPDSKARSFGVGRSPMTGLRTETPASVVSDRVSELMLRLQHVPGSDAASLTPPRRRRVQRASGRRSRRETCASSSASPPRSAASSRQRAPSQSSRSTRPRGRQSRLPLMPSPQASSVAASSSTGAFQQFRASVMSRPRLPPVAKTPSEPPSSVPNVEALRPGGTSEMGRTKLVVVRWDVSKRKSVGRVRVFGGGALARLPEPQRQGTDGSLRAALLQRATESSPGNTEDLYRRILHSRPQKPRSLAPLQVSPQRRSPSRSPNSKRGSPRRSASPVMPPLSGRGSPASARLRRKEAASVPLIAFQRRREAADRAGPADSKRPPPRPPVPYSQYEAALEHNAQLLQRIAELESVGKAARRKVPSPAKKHFTP
eukprot:TRINITY_DN16551_c0_g1_i2.p1 TRINITY_DN16551_c0_g1~~TRINITY_DN16551_c0_g1_i2.p1  ORF type:complete len:672 (+),score=252.23 TRINITY_DN16551_c0_g1_i2:53-2017(+)